jgi:hypothetical protein
VAVYKRAGWVEGNQFSPSNDLSIDLPINTSFIPIGSTLVRTWIDVRFNQFGIGTEPPEIINQTGPWIWGVCYIDDSHTSPAQHAEDDTIDWLWREMVVWQAPVQSPNAITGDSQWIRASSPPPGLRDSKGQRILGDTHPALHFALNRPLVTSDPPPGLLFEIFVHALFLQH